MRKVIFLSIILGLAGCSIFPDVKENLPLYTLQSGKVNPSTPLKKPLAIELPRSESSLDTYRIAVTLPPYRREYLANAQWPDTLPQILQEIFIETFEERWGPPSINRSEDGLQSLYGLSSSLQDFSIYHRGGSCAEVRLKMSFKIINLQDRRAIAGRTFCQTVKVLSPASEEVVGAFNRGLQELLNKTILWIEEILLRREPRATTLLTPDLVRKHILS